MIEIIDSVAIIAKNEEEALSILEGLEHDDIIDAFDEEYEEVDNKENALRLAAGIGLGVGAIYANGSFEDHDEIVDRIFANLNSYMADDDFLFTYSYECA